MLSNIGIVYAWWGLGLTDLKGGREGGRTQHDVLVGSMHTIDE